MTKDSGSHQIRHSGASHRSSLIFDQSIVPRDKCSRAPPPSPKHGEARQYRDELCSGCRLRNHEAAFRHCGRVTLGRLGDPHAIDPLHGFGHPRFWRRASRLETRCAARRTAGSPYTTPAAARVLVHKPTESSEAVAIAPCPPGPSPGTAGRPRRFDVGAPKARRKTHSSPPNVDR